MVKRTSNYNQQSESNFGNRESEKEVGPNCELQLSGINGAIPVENVSFSEEADTSEVSYNDSFAQSIAVTGVSFSGSFDIPGNANRVRDQSWDLGSDTEENSVLPKYVSSLTIVDGEERKYTFTEVLISSHSKDIPSDDRTSSSFDFMAEKMYIEE